MSATRVDAPIYIVTHELRGSCVVLSIRGVVVSFRGQTNPGNVGVDLE